MGDVLPFPGFAEAVALNGAGKDDGGAAFVFKGGFVGGVNFARIVAAKTQAAKRFIGKRVDEFQKTRIAAKEKLADVRAAGNNEFLVFAVDHFAHALDEKAFGVALDDGIPFRAPEDFDDVPASAAEGGFEFLNNLAIAAHGAIEALKIAVDDEDEVVEFFPGGEGDGAKGFGLIGLAVAKEGPDFGVGNGLEAAIFEIAIEARLIDGHERAESHGDGGEFPEVGHEPGVRVGREAATGLEFTAKIHELFDTEAAFEKGASVNAGSGVALEIDGVAFKRIGTRAKEMVEADFVERGGGGIGGDVAADVVLEAIGADDHGEGVPTNEGLDAALELLVAGEKGFEARGNGVGVRGVGGKRKIDAADGGVGAEALHDLAGHFGAAGEKDGVEGFEPFLDFDVLDVARHVSFLIHGSDGLLPSRRGAGACAE